MGVHTNIYKYPIRLISSDKLCSTIKYRKIFSYSPMLGSINYSLSFFRSSLIFFSGFSIRDYFFNSYTSIDTNFNKVYSGDFFINFISSKKRILITMKSLRFYITRLFFKDCRLYKYKWKVRNYFKGGLSRLVLNRSSISNILSRCGLIEKKDVNFFFFNNLVYLNGSICKSDLNLTVGDRLQLVVNPYIYIYSKYLFSNFLLNFNKLNSLKKKKLSPEPWILSLMQNWFGIPQFLEVDYLCLCIFVLFNTYWRDVLVDWRLGYYFYFYSRFFTWRYLYK